MWRRIAAEGIEVDALWTQSGWGLNNNNNVSTELRPYSQFLTFSKVCCQSVCLKEWSRRFWHYSLLSMRVNVLLWWITGLDVVYSFRMSLFIKDNRHITGQKKRKETVVMIKWIKRRIQKFESKHYSCCRLILSWAPKNTIDRIIVKRKYWNKILISEFSRPK